MDTSIFNSLSPEEKQKKINDSIIKHLKHLESLKILINQSFSKNDAV